MQKGSTILSIDFGTTNCKTAVFDGSGSILVHSEGSYPMHSPAPGRFEQKPAEWEATLLACLKSLGSPAKEAVIVSVTGQGSTSVCLDSSGRVIEPVISHLDTRFLGTHRGGASAAKMGYVAAKMAGPLTWLKANRPNDFRRVCLVLDVREYIGYVLTGNATHDSSAYPGRTSGEFERLIGLEEGVMGVPHDSSSPIGPVARRFAGKSGLRRGVPVLLAPFDGLCSVVGVGVDRKGLLADVPGSTEVVSTPVDPGSSHEVIPHALGDLSLFYSSPPLGSLYQWFRDQFYGRSRRYFARMDRDASRAKPGSGGVLCVPRISYRGFNASYSLDFHNLSASTGRSELTRSVMEGLAFHVFGMVSTLLSSGLKIRQVRLGGGGASGSVWNQMRADIYGIETAVPQTLSVGCLGSAIFGSVAAGMHSDVGEAVSRMVRVSRTYHPRPEIHREYMKINERFRAINAATSEPHPRLTFKSQPAVQGARTLGR